MREFYLRYLAACNAHDFGSLGRFVADDVRVNGDGTGLAGYVSGLRAVVTAFPDYRWELRELLIDADRIAARFEDSGTHHGAFLGVAATGRPVRLQESRSTGSRAAGSPRCG
jgi:predicted ester cyclase